MNLDNRDHHAPRRTHSFDSYDSLERLEERRQRRQQFFANRAMFDQQPKLPVPPPPDGNQSTRCLSPTSKLIQGYTDRLKEFSLTPNSTDSKEPPIPAKRASSTGKIKVISLESPKKVTYKTTCHVFPAFKVPPEDAVKEPEVVQDKDIHGWTNARPFQPTHFRPLERSFSYLDEQIISRENSFTESTDSSFITQANVLQLRGKAFQRSIYDDPLVPGEEGAVMRRTAHQDNMKKPVNEPIAMKKHITEDENKNYATPFHVVDRPRSSSPSTPKSYPVYLRQQSGREWRPVNAAFDRGSSAYSSLPHRRSHTDRQKLLDEPDTAQRNQNAPNPTFDRASSTYSSLPHRRGHTDHQKLLDEPDTAQRNQNEPNATFDRASSVYSSLPHRSGQMNRPRTFNDTAQPHTRRISTGSATEMKLRSKTPRMPVKDLIQKFSNK